MQKRNNYLIQAADAKKRFLSYDQDTLIQKFHLKSDANYLYTTMLSLPYRINRTTGDFQRMESGTWTDANTYNEIMTFDFVDHNKLWKIIQEMGILDHLTCLLRNLHVSQEATVRTEHGTTDWFQIGKGVCQGCILLRCLFNLYAEYIMKNAGLEEAQAGIKIVGRNINNLRYAEDTTLMAESKKLKSFLMKEKEESGNLA